MTLYYRPLARTDAPRPTDALMLAGAWCWFNEVEVLSRNAEPDVVPVDRVPADVLERLTAKRAPISNLSMDAPQIMGILNVTPDSFSDGGKHNATGDAAARAIEMIAEGASIIDIGGESTRPGADFVPAEEEIFRVAEPIRGLRSASKVIISIDTRKADVAEAAVAAGATLINDVAAFTYDPAMAKVAARHDLPVCLMHAQGDPKTMQADPVYGDVLLDVYDFLAERVETAVEAGIARDRIIVDPGIGFGKTLQHNLTLLRGLGLFHGLGCPILLGASRKKFIGTLGNAPVASDRLAGSVSAALFGINQGVQILRVHDIFATKQAIDLQLAMIGTQANGS